jgi:assimilatory nitrate reductase catalytic subunit
MNVHTEMPLPVRTTCPYCGVGCGVLARADGQGGAEILGDPEHPANFGRLCSKGSALGDTLGLATRLLYPQLRSADGSLTRASWDTALDRVAYGFADTIAEYGPDSVALYLSGQLLTEDYYVANKLMKGFLGSANVDTNSRLCMASSVAGHRRAFGADIVPGTYEDLDLADLIVLVGSNAAWCHPVLYQRIAANKRARGAKVVVIDPRRTATAEDADLFLPVAPGMDTVLFSGLLVDLADTHALDYAYIEAHTSGFADALVRAREIAPSIKAASFATGIAEAELTRFFELFRATPKVVTCFSQGVNQSAQGTDKVNAIINCHLATARIGREGMGPFSLTGQPNAMGGREVGGLANQLAAHMNFSPDEIDRVARFWRAPNIVRGEGLKAVQLFEAVARGQIKALWVMATNPAVSLPQAGDVRDALRKLDLFVVSENVCSNDTVNAGAHVLLPAAAWGEKDGTVTNSERRISRQRAFLAPPGEAMPDWWIVSEVARRMGLGDAFAYSSVADVFREHAALSAFENDGARDFDIGALAALSDQAFNALSPVQWPSRAGTPKAEPRFFARGGFFTPDRKARMIAPERPQLREGVSAEFPLRLNTGRVRDQWHTMARSGLSARLANHLPEPFVEIHPDDATRFGVSEGGFARITSLHGSCVLKVTLKDDQRRGAIFAPIHWSGETASSARVGALVASEVDPFSGQPEAKATPVAIAPVSFAYHGFALGLSRDALPPDSWWAAVTISNGSGLLLASEVSLDMWSEHFRGAVGNAELAEYRDAFRGIYRVAAFDNGKLSACLFLGPPDAMSAWDQIKALFEAGVIEAVQRQALLSGRAASGAASAGPIVCACFSVGLATIRATIESGEAGTVEEIGKLLRAGTNCGSCVPELKRIIATTSAPQLT